MLRIAAAVLVLLIHAVNRSAAQEPFLGPPPVAPAVSTAGTSGGARAQADGQWIDTGNRETVRTTFLSSIAATRNAAMTWTGAVASCSEGAASNGFRSAVIGRSNWYRAMAGVPATVTLDTAAVGPASQAALMMSANRTLSHFPPGSWTCYSAGGASSAGKSNLCLQWSPIGDTGCVEGYMLDWGSTNNFVGHRRWILYPQTTSFGTGDVDRTGSFPSGYPWANALQVIQQSTFGSPRPATREAFVAWPPPGYVPYQAVYPRWSFSYDGAGFSGATVTMTQGGTSIPVAMEPQAQGYGENTLVWVAAGLDANSFASAWSQPSSDTTIRVTVNGVTVSGVARQFTYDVIVFDPGGGGSTAPTAPSNPSPANGAAAVAVGTALGWTGSGGATSYDVYFGTAPSPPLVGNTTSTSYSPGALAGVTLYYWKVVAKNATASASSPVWSFTTASANVAIVTPVQGQTLTTAGVSFAWNALAGSTGYDILVTGAGGATVLTASLTGAASTQTLATLPAGTYRLRVRSCRNGGFGDANCTAAAMRDFSVSLAAPSAAPSTVLPTAGATLTTSTQTLSWSAVTGAASYEALLDDIAAGTTELQIRTPATSTVFTMPGSTSYRFRVRACSVACGPWSAALFFAVNLPPVPSAAPVITSSSVTGTTLSLAWTPVSGADVYDIQVVQPPPAGPGGGALTVASGRVSGNSATLTVPVGAAQVLVAGCNGNGCGPASAPTPISPTGTNPAGPVLGSPAAGSTVNGPVVFFSWSRAPGDNGSNTVYRLYVQDLSRQAAALDVLTSANFHAAYFNAEGARYDALVIVNFGAAGQTAGPAAGFVVRGSSSTAPTMVAPRQNGSVKQGNIELSWTPVPGATLYEYYVSGPRNPTVRGVTPGLVVQVPLAAEGGAAGTTYNGIVRGCPAGAGCAPGGTAGWGPWSNAAGPGTATFVVVP